MSILRQNNYLAGMRVDVPTLRATDSSVCGDFDMLIGRNIAGQSGYVVRGFALNTTNAIGSPAIALSMTVADSILINLNASESGSMFWVPTDRAAETLTSTNVNVSGSFTANTTNYIGIDLKRSADTTTTDLVQFLDANTDLEVAKEVPLARTLNYRIVIGTQSFASQSNVVPVAIITTDTNNNVLTITDARPMLYRLGTGGDTPNAQFYYNYPAGQFELLTGNVFAGGDKQFQSQKDWMNALMTRVYQIGGGEYWYGPTADRNVEMATTGAALGTGQWFDYTGTTLKWTGITFLFDNSSQAGVYYNEVNNNTIGVTVNDGYCMYVVLDRSTNHVRGVNGLVMQGPVLLTQVGSAINYADLQIVVWVSGGQAFSRGSSTAIGNPVPVATTSSDGIVRLGQTPEVPLHPVVPNFGSGHAIAWTGTSGTSLAVTGPTNAIAIEGIGTGASGVGVVGLSNGATAGSGVAGVAGYGASTAPGVYGEATGDNAPGAWGKGKDSAGTNTNYGVKGVGGASSGSDASAGGFFQGGKTTSSGSAHGQGILAYGGSGAGSGNNQGGTGIFAQGGDANSGGGAKDGGPGVYGQGGAQAGGGTDGPGGRFHPASGTAFTAIDAIGYITMGSGTQPTSTTGFSNTLTKKNICKFWTSIVRGGSPGTFSETSFNLGTLGLTGTTRLDITFATALTGAYSIVASGESAAGDIYVAVIPSALKSGSGFSIELVLIGSPGGAYVGTLLSLHDSTDWTLNIQVFGEQ